MTYTTNTLQLINDLRDARATSTEATKTVETKRETLIKAIMKDTLALRVDNKDMPFNKFLKACNAELLAEVSEDEQSLTATINLTITIISKELTKATYKQMKAYEKYADYVIQADAKKDLGKALSSAKKKYEDKAVEGYNYTDIEEIAKLQEALSIIKGRLTKKA